MKKFTLSASFLLIVSSLSLYSCDIDVDSLSIYQTSSSSTSIENSVDMDTSVEELSDDSSSSTCAVVETSSSLLVTVLEMKGSYGDSTLFSYTYEDGDEEKTFDILIDGGTESVSTTSAGASLPALLQEQVTDHVLDVVILSHQHTDHYYGFKNNALQNGGITAIGYVIDNGVSGYNSTYKTVWETQVRDYWVNKGSTYYPIQTILEDGGDIVINEEAVLHFLDTGNYPTYGSTGNKDDANRDSIALCLRFGDIAFVCAGDLASSEIESEVMSLNSNEEGKPWFTECASTVIYKAAHHGARTYGTNSQAYTNWIAPDYAWSSSAILSDNQSSSGKWTSQHPYNEAYQHIVTAIGNNSSFAEDEIAADRYFYNGTMGSFHFEWESLFNDVSIYGEGRKNADYYDGSGNLVDPEEEKDLPFYKTVFFKRGGYSN